MKNDAYYIGKLRKQSDISELFMDLLEYFDGKQDAETFPDGHTQANEEMKFHMRISAILEGKDNA